MIAHFYHVWVDGDWEGPTVGDYKRPGDAHATALRTCGLRPDLLTVTLIGTPANRAAARTWYRRADLGAELRFIQADTGWEDVTLQHIRDWAPTVDPATPILYAHAKGSYNLTAITAKHRDIMTEGVIGRWQQAIRALRTADAAGCFWDGRIFTGNFWWANAGYLAQLPDVPHANRYEAENWIGLGNPTICELADITYAQLAEAQLGRHQPEPATITPGGVYQLGAAAPPAKPLGRGTRWD